MEERLTNLEIKMAYLEKTCGDLDAVVRQLNDELGLLRREVGRLRELERDGREHAAKLVHDKPPHY